VYIDAHGAAGLLTMIGISSGTSVRTFVGKKNDFRWKRRTSSIDVQFSFVDKYL
jgi:hypothetical protein